MSAPDTKPAEPDFTKVKAKISLKAFIQASIFQATIDVRYYLCGIRVDRAEAGGTYVVASDGHTMLVHYDAEGVLEGADSIIVRAPHAAVVQAGAAMRKKDVGYSVIVEGHRLSVAPDFGMAHQSNLELYVMPGSCQITVPGISAYTGKQMFDWRAVVPKFENLKQALISDLNPAYLARLDRAARVGLSNNTSRLVSVRFWQANESSVAAVQFESSPETLALIMPVKRQSEDPSPMFKRIHPITT